MQIFCNKSATKCTYLREAFTVRDRGGWCGEAIEAMGKKLKIRHLSLRAIWIFGMVASCVPHVLWSQEIRPQKTPLQNTLPPKINITPKEPQEEVQPAPAHLVTVPNLIWLSPSQARIELESMNLPAKMQGIENGTENSVLVVISQSIEPGTQVPPGRPIELSLGKPKLVLQADNQRPQINQKVHFTVRLVPEWPKPGPPNTTYAFTFDRTPVTSVSLSANSFRKQIEQAPSADHQFDEPGSYLAIVSAIIDDRSLTSDPVTIEVSKPSVSNSLPTPARTSTPKKSPPRPPGVAGEVAKAEEKNRQATPTPTPKPSGDMQAVLRLASIVILILATVVAAYCVRKWRKAKIESPQHVQPSSMKVKVTTGNRRIEAKILEPERLKSKCLTRVRWVRGSMYSKLTQERIVKKGAAHV
jgi:PASTA domain